MSEHDYIDAKFEVVSDPNALPGPRPPVDIVRLLQWTFLGFMGLVVLLTAFCLAGAPDETAGLTATNALDPAPTATLQLENGPVEIPTVRRAAAP